MTVTTWSLLDILFEDIPRTDRDLHQNVFFVFISQNPEIIILDFRAKPFLKSRPSKLCSIWKGTQRQQTVQKAVLLVQKWPRYAKLSSCSEIFSQNGRTHPHTSIWTQKAHLKNPFSKRWFSTQNYTVVPPNYLVCKIVKNTFLGGEFFSLKFFVKYRKDVLLVLQRRHKTRRKTFCRKNFPRLGCLGQFNFVLTRESRLIQYSLAEILG